MSQVRVTDFFSQRKKAAAAPDAKPRRSSVTDYGLPRCSTSVHQEFVRVIDEAAGLHAGDSVGGSEAGCSPRSSKRCPDRGEAACSVKKRRQTETSSGTNAGRGPRKTARKKLLLPGDEPQVLSSDDITTLKSRLQKIRKQAEKITTRSACSTTTSYAACPEDVPPSSSSSVAHPEDVPPSSSTSVAHPEDVPPRSSTSVAHPEDVPPSSSTSVAHPEDVPPRSSSTSVAHPEDVPPSSSTSCMSPTSSAACPEDAPTDVEALQGSVVLAKELAAKVRKRKVIRPPEDILQEDIPPQDNARAPAYHRYHALAQDAPPGLVLPLHYRLLAEMFRSMDSIVAIMYNRSETATFSKVKQGVQDMTHRRFEESHIGQMKTVFPEAYAFKREKSGFMSSSSVPQSRYQLTVEPLIVSDQNEARPVLTASRLLARRRHFHQSLVSIVKRHHQVFLSSLVPPLSVPEDQLTRWHPRFGVDTVPAVWASPLPVVPHAAKLSTAQEVLDRARSSITPKMQKALVDLTSRTDVTDADQVDRTDPQKPAPQIQVPVSLKGVSQSLLERIRAKEAQKLQAAMTRSPVQEERLLMMSRLGELARILRNVFVAEKKPALIMEVLCKRMVASYRTALSAGEMERHLRLLAEVAADWISIHPVRKDVYLKLNQRVELSSVLEQLSCRLREEECR